MKEKNKIFSKTIAGMATISVMLGATTPVFAYTKEETVYSKMNTQGDIYSTTVSNHLKNTENEKLIKDLSELTNIENTNGEETYEQKENELLWQANGNDIYYQGNTQKELPVNCQIRYELDGKNISAEELAGKRGRATIYIKYENKEKHEVDINGTKEILYTPFIVGVGTILDNTKAKNITVTNGKVVDNGKDSIILGVAFPGLQESLGIEKDKIEIPTEIVISYDTENFEMGNIISYITPKLLEEEDNISIDGIQKIVAQIDNLKSASKQLVQGTGDLYTGTMSYVEKSQQFGEAMNQLSEGVTTIHKNYNSIDNGIANIQEGANSLNKGAEELNTGVKQVSTGIASISSGAQTAKQAATEALSKSNKELEKGIDSLIQGKEQETETIKKQIITNGNEELKKGLKSEAGKEVNKNVNSALTKVLSDDSIGLTEEQKKAITKGMRENLSTQDLNAKIDTAIDNAVAKEKAGIDQINNNEKGVKAGLKTLKTATATNMKQGVSSIGEAFEQIEEGATLLKQNVDEKLQTGTKTLEQGTKELSKGSKSLKEGSKQMMQGMDTLNSSSTQLNSANQQLIEGANTIYQGTEILSKGMISFDEEGIQKIAHYIEKDVNNLQKRLEILNDLSNEYNEFSNKEENIQGKVKFIIMTDSIKKKEEVEALPAEENKQEQQK